MSASLDRFSSGAPSAGLDLGDANVWTTTSAGAAGIAAIEAQSNLAVGDYCVIDSAGSPVTFVWDGTEFLRAHQFGGTRYAATVSDYMDADPASMSPAWVEVEGATGGAVNFNSTVASKIAVLGGTTALSSATSSLTFTTSPAAAAGFIIRDAKAATATNNSGYRTPVNFGGTLKLVNLLTHTTGSATNWSFLDATTYRDTGIAFGTSKTLEVFVKADGTIRVFVDWAAQPSYSASLTLLTTAATSASWQGVNASGLIEGTSGYHFTLDAG